jgi:serine phosphatase RsbU (regulator of sigma subunit)/anti-sigma regulatory factor (Ser/Thr protein kinase)
VLLSNLAAQAAPAVRVAQLVRQQQIEAQSRERLEQEMRVARLIQQTLLPQQLPAITGWDVSAYYQPARAVGGDFYDFIYLADGRLGIVVGDVTDKGVPAALVMATTRASLRAAAQRFDSPGQVLSQVNDTLCPDIPARMFVTCIYAILDTATGKLVFANAGHDVAFCWSSANGVSELRARGMPLGLMTGMTYEEKETTVMVNDSLIFYSDGLVEAHNPQRDMFGFPRLSHLLSEHPGGASVIPFLLEQRASFTGPNWEQEDDTTMVIVQRTSGPSAQWEIISTFNIPSQPGNEREAMKRVGDCVQTLGIAQTRVDKLKTAVAEATMNAIEHGNQNRADLAVEITVAVPPNKTAVMVRIKDHALSGAQSTAPTTPDLDAKLAGLQTPRGWGLFLIEKMVDKMNVIDGSDHHILELIMNTDGGPHA